MRSLVTSKLSCMLALFSRSFLQLFVVLVHVDISLFYVPRRLCVSAYARPIQARTVSKAGHLSQERIQGFGAPFLLSLFSSHFHIIYLLCSGNIPLHFHYAQARMSCRSAGVTGSRSSATSPHITAHGRKRSNRP